MNENSPELLIVDDDQVSSMALKKKLEKRGFRIKTLQDGRRCLDLIAENKFDLILLDILMPNVSGFDLLKEIRTKYTTAELPIVMVTAKDEPEDIVEALNYGANDYLTKPVNIDIAVARVKTRLEVVKLTKDSIRKKELEAVNAMIATYNHELNNSLAIAMTAANRIKAKVDLSLSEKLDRSLWRIRDIVEKIGGVAETKEVAFEQYTEESKMVKID